MKKIILIGATLIAAAAARAERTWVLDAGSLANVVLSNSVKPDNGSSYNLDAQNLYLSFGYNAGEMEFGPILAYGNKTVNSVSTKTKTFGAYFKYNFVPNINANSVIPFAKIAIKSSDEETQTSTSKVFGWEVAGGATFFPFNNLVGIDGMLAYKNDKDSGDIPGTTSGFALKTAFNLYF